MGRRNRKRQAYHVGLALLAAMILTAAMLAGFTLAGCKGKAEVAPQPPTQATPQPAAQPQQTAVGGAEEGSKAPDFSVTDIEGNVHSLKDYAGRVLVVDFWATYCDPCVKKLREYESLYQAYHDQGVDFLALSLDESDAVIKGWREENDVTFPLARCDGKTKAVFLGNDPHVSVPIPQVRIVGRKGVVRYSFGPEGEVEQVEDAIKALVAEKQ